jgi:hypothetical protein
VSKKWTKLPRGVTWKQVNESRRRRKFLETLKHPKQKYVELTHDGTDFTFDYGGTATVVRKEDEWHVYGTGLS